MVVTLEKGFESDSQRLIINHLETAHEELRGITWSGWDTFCAIYSVSGRVPVKLYIYLSPQLGSNAST
jgi:hypothetical protein